MPTPRSWTSRRQCLSPLAKDRPRNAGAVAEVVHDYLALAEERARTSALAAAEARAEAERAEQESKDQRRVRRLGLTLATTVLGALLVGGGSYLWLGKVKQARAKRQRTAVTSALTEAQRLQGEEHWQGALVAATQALELARAEGTDAGTLQRASDLRAEIAQAESRAREASEQAARDEKLLAGLEEARLIRFDEFFRAVTSDEAYVHAFEEYGLDIDTLELSGLLAALLDRGTAFAVPVAAALDDWAWIRTKMDGGPSELASKLRSLAEAIDPSPAQNRLRKLVREADAAGLRALAASPQGGELPARGLKRLGGKLWGLGHEDEALHVYRLALVRYPDDIWLHASLGQCYGTARPEAARRHYMAVVALRPESAIAHNLLGAVLCDGIRDYEAALREFDRAIELDPAKAFLHTNRGNALQWLGRSREATAAFERAIALDPTYPRGHQGLAWSFRERGRLAEALKAAEEGRRLAPERAWSHVICGQVLVDLHRSEEALAAYRTALSLDPQLADAHHSIGLALIRQGSHEEGLEALEKAIHRQPNNGLFRSNFSVALARAGREDEARAQAQRALALAPDDMYVLTNQSLWLQEAGHPEEALPLAERAVKLRPDLARCHAVLAGALLRVKKFDAALAEADVALHLDSECLAAHSIRGGALSNLGRDAEAKVAWEKQIELHPNSQPAAWSHACLAMLQEKAGRIEEAVAGYRRSLSLYRSSLETARSLSQLLLRLDRLEEAIQLWREQLEFEPWRADNYVELAVLLSRAGRPTEAWELVGKALDVDPGHARARMLTSTLSPDGPGSAASIAAGRENVRLNPQSPYAHHGLAAAYLEAGRYTEAVTTARRAVELDPNLAVSHVLLGLALRQAGAPEEAVPVLEAAIRLAPRDARGHAGLAFCDMDMGHMEESEKGFRTAIRLDPTRYDHHENLGVVLLRQGRTDEGVESLRVAIERSPAQASPHYNLSTALARAGDWDGALRESRAAVRLRPDVAEYRCALGQTLVQTYQREEGLAQLREGLRLGADSAQCHYMAAHVHALAWLPDEAATLYERAIQLDPQLAEAHCNLAGLYRNMGRLRESLGLYRRGHALGSKQAGWPYPSAQWVRDAERLAKLEDRLPAFLDGSDKPELPVDMLWVAEVATYRKLHAASARMRSLAMKAVPLWAANPGSGIRYNAACQAALAGAGEGEDGPSLSPAERATWRKQAVAWLRADLVILRSALSASPANAEAIRELLLHWLEDADLAGIRDEATVEELPEDERATCRALWKDVAGLLE